MGSSDRRERTSSPCTSTRSALRWRSLIGQTLRQTLVGLPQQIRRLQQPLNSQGSPACAQRICPASAPLAQESKVESTPPGVGASPTTIPSPDVRPSAPAPCSSRSKSQRQAPIATAPPARRTTTGDHTPLHDIASGGGRQR